jgi:hypothetical protein
MAAGLGFKNFTSGEVLTAADVNGYLMQGVGVFTDAANRDAEITSPQEGQFAYLKDTNVTTYYTGSAWANLDTTGMTNPMTTTGDTIYSSSGSTPARLGIGTAGQVLRVNSGATAPEWAAAAGFNPTASSLITASQSTSSSTYTGLATAQSVTVTTGTKALVILTTTLAGSADNFIYFSFAVSGATTRAASDTEAILWRSSNASNPWLGASRVIYLTGLTAGSNTFTVQVRRAGANSADYQDRQIIVADMGS